MVDERDRPPVRRYPHVADPAGGFEEDLPDRVLEAARVAGESHHRQSLAVGRPVGVLDVFEDFSGRAAGERHARERPGGLEAEQMPAVERERQLALRRHGEKIGAGEAEGARLGAVGSRGEDLHGPALPRRAVDDRLAVRREARTVDRAARVGQPLKLQRCMAAAGETARQKAEADSDQERGCGESESSATSCSCGLRGGERPRGGGLGQMIAEVLQVPREVLRRGVALLRILGETAFDDPAHGGGGLRRRLRERLRLLANDRHERLGARLPLEGALARGHLVEDRAERELVRAEVHRLPARLLGRHVAGRAHDRSRFGRRGDRGRKDGGVLGRRLGQLGQAEVEDLDVAVLRDHQVLGLQVPMDDAGAMRLGQSLGDLDGKIEEPARRQRLSRSEQLAERLSLDELHGDVQSAVGLADVVDGEDVGVVQRGGGARLLFEALSSPVVPGHRRGEHLDRDLAAELGVLRPVHLTHPARAQRRDDLVGSEAATRRGRQGDGILFDRHL